MSASIFSSSPVTSTMTVSLPTSTMPARKMSTICMISARLSLLDFTLSRAISRTTLLSDEMFVTRTTSMSL